MYYAFIYMPTFINLYRDSKINYTEKFSKKPFMISTKTINSFFLNIYPIITILNTMLHIIIWLITCLFDFVDFISNITYDKSIKKITLKNHLSVFRISVQHKVKVSIIFILWKIMQIVQMKIFLNNPSALHDLLM